MHMKLVAIHALFFFIFFFIHPIYCICSWDNCPSYSNEPSVLNVHLIPHSHDDLGWIKTVDQYYYGSKPELVPVGVQYIYNTVIDELKKDKARRFSIAEAGFLYRWITSGPQTSIARLQHFVKSGQIEIIGGGWVQNDEAAAHYVDIIDQMTYGLSKMTKWFKSCGIPPVAWQIDPFGHSQEMANLLALMNYTDVYFARLHYLEKAKRIRERSLDFNWLGTPSGKTQIRGHAFYQDNYGPPPGFCFDILCGDDPIMDNKELEDYNLDKKINDFVSYVRNQSKVEVTNHIPLLMGSDFQYTSANTWYINLDKIIYYINANPSYKMRVFYSTPSCYSKAMSEDAKLSVKKDDFFPYASAEHSYWTGYFTSRPVLKGLIREASNRAQLAKLLLAKHPNIIQKSKFEYIIKASSLNQHHDAVTGTAKENVTQDYILHLHKAALVLEEMVNFALETQVENKTDFKFCFFTNETICDVLNSNGINTVAVFNPSDRNISRVIRFPHYQKVARVMSKHARHPEAEIFIAPPIRSLKSTEAARYELHLLAEVEAFGVSLYRISPHLVSAEKCQIMENFAKFSKNIPFAESEKKIENEFVRVMFDEKGFLKSIYNKKSQKLHNIKQEFLMYTGVTNKNDTQPSGAYIFRPLKQEPEIISSVIETTIIEGSLSREVRQQISPWIYQTIRLGLNSEVVEFDWVVGPIPKEKENPLTREIVTRYITDIKNNGEFYTDSNGRQLLKRKMKFNPSFTYEDTEPVAGNYYPITTQVSINDSNSQCSVFVDRAQGATSGNGIIEIMLHRRCHTDDHFGVEEALDEPGRNGAGLVVRGSHYLTIGNHENTIIQNSLQKYEVFNKPILAFSNTFTSKKCNNFFKTKKHLRMSYELPHYLHIITLERVSQNKLLLRIEHNGAGPAATINIRDVLPFLRKMALIEMNLSGTRVLHRPNTSLVTIYPYDITTYFIIDG